MSQNIVNLLGAGSGIDTKALVDQLVEVEKSAKQESIDTTRELKETQISDFGLLNSALSTLNDAAEALGDADTFNSKSAAFSDSSALVPVSLDPEAQTGEYAFTVSELAASQSLSTDASFSDPSDAVGLGTLTFNFGRWDVVTPPADPATFTRDTDSTTQTITIDSSNNSLTGLANAINEADFGVQASILNDGSGYRLVMRADSGLDNQLEISVSESGASPSNTDDTGLSRFAFSGGGFQMTQNQVGQDAEFTVNGLAVTRETNKIDDVIDGFEFTLSGTTSGSETININIEEDKTTAEQTVRDFVEAYNLFLEAVEPLIGYNEEEGEYGSLYNDTLAKNMPGRIRQILLGAVPGLGGDNTLLANIGIGTERDGTMSLDEDTFSEAVDDNYDVFKELFIPVKSSNSEQIAINSYGDSTVSGEYEVLITTRPSKGNMVGTDIAAGLLAGLAADVPTSATLTGATNTAVLADFIATSGNFTTSTVNAPLDLATQGVGANDYDFSITVDGVTSAANISLPVADYANYDDMATALQTAVNGDANISGVSVSYTASTDQFVFTSGSDGAASSVSLTAVGGSSSNLGIADGASTSGTGGANDYDFTLDVDGTTSGTISLTPGTYATFDELATHIQTQINADATLSGAGASVSVSHDGTAFVIASSSTGVSSTIANATAIGSRASTLGITTGAATQGAATGGNTSAYDFTMTLNGTESGTISLDTGTYADMGAVASEIEQQINADATLSGAGASVNVSYDATLNNFVIESDKFGNTSTVSLSAVGGSVGDLGLITGKFTSGTLSLPLDLASQGHSAGDYDFTITVDGVASAGNISLPIADYASYDAMATALQTAVNGDANISGTSVIYDSENSQFRFISGTTGSSSSVSLTQVGSRSSQLGISSGNASAGGSGDNVGVNVAGTINGVAGFGSGSVLLPALGEPGESLGLVVSESATSATVNLSRGFGGELKLLIDEFLSTNGIIDLREESLDGDIEDLDEDQLKLDRRVEAYRERLTSQFIAMESIVRSLQSSSSYLESIMSSLLNSNSDG